jgi:hypothetical protein
MSTIITIWRLDRIVDFGWRLEERGTGSVASSMMDRVGKVA